LCLADYYFKAQQYDKASDVYEKALEQHSKSTSLGLGYCINLTFTNTSENRQKAADFAAQKIRNGELEYQNSFLNAICRLAENGFLDTPKYLVDMGLEIYESHAINLLHLDLFVKFIEQFCVAIFNSKNLVKEKIDKEKVIACFRRYQSLGGSFTQIASGISMSVSDYLKVIFDHMDSVDLVEEFIKGETNAERGVSDNEEISQRIKAGELIVAHIARCINHKGFCFAKDLKGEMFFCHFARMITEFDGSQDLIAVGSLIALQPAESSHPDQYRVADEFYLIPNDWVSLSQS
jgi:hypothetical protein